MLERRECEDREKGLGGVVYGSESCEERVQAGCVQEVGVLVIREGGTYGGELSFEFGDAGLDEVIGGEGGFDGYDAVCEEDAGDWLICFLGHFLAGREEGVECLG